MTIHPQIIRTEGGEELVVLPLADYNALLAAAEADEDAADVAAYDAAKAELAAGRTGAHPPDVSAMILKGATPLTALRKARKMTQEQLAEAAGVGQGYLSQIENRARTGSPETLERLARALDVSVDQIA